MARGRIDVTTAAELCRRRDIRLVFLDASMQVFPHPVRELRAALPKAVIAYDASHVMGVVAGGQFQSPIAEGADLIQGSTHKSLFGPQKGLFVFADEGPVNERIRSTVTPLFVSNSHPHHIAALAVALQEIIDFGADYAATVVANARRLAAELCAAGARIAFADEGFTECHQLFWAVGSRAEAEEYWAALEKVGLHVNMIRVPFARDTFGFRVGVAEATRRGFQPDHMGMVASLLIAARGGSADKIGSTVAELSAAFPGLYYGYNVDGSALPHRGVTNGATCVV